MVALPAPGTPGGGPPGNVLPFPSGPPPNVLPFPGSKPPPNVLPFPGTPGGRPPNVIPFPGKPRALPTPEPPPTPRPVAPPPPFSSLQMLDPVEAALLLGDLGDLPGGAPKPTISQPPFEGGQVPGAMYRGRVTGYFIYERPNGPPLLGTQGTISTQPPGGMRGPITSFSAGVRSEGRTIFVEMGNGLSVQTGGSTQSNADGAIIVSSGVFRLDGTPPELDAQQGGNPPGVNTPIGMPFSGAPPAAPPEAPPIIPDTVPPNLPPGIPDPNEPTDPSIPDFVPEILPDGIPDPDYPDPGPGPEPDENDPANPDVPPEEEPNAPPEKPPPVPEEPPVPVPPLFPDFPEIPDIPDFPEIPDNPEELDQPTIPDPLLPDPLPVPGLNPNIPGQPDFPGIPWLVPEIPGQPTDPFTPAEPWGPFNPALPGPGLNPGLPGFPDFPGIPDFPGKNPNNPSTPGNPNIPGLNPGNPSIPGNPDFPGIPFFPDLVPELPPPEKKCPEGCVPEKKPEEEVNICSQPCIQTLLSRTREILSDVEALKRNVNAVREDVTEVKGGVQGIAQELIFMGIDINVIEDLARDVKEELTDDQEITLPYSDCESETARETPVGGKPLKAIARAIQVLATHADNRGKKLCDLDNIDRIYRILGGDNWFRSEQQQAPSMSLNPETSIEAKRSEAFEGDTPKEIQVSNLVALLQSLASVNHHRSGHHELPASVPEDLTNDSSPTKRLETQMQWDEWAIRQLDGLMGAWPLKIKYRDANNKTVELEFKNLAELQAELMGLVLGVAADTDILQELGFKGIAETIKAQSSAIRAADYSKANAEFLGYKYNERGRNLPLSITPGAKSIKDALKTSTQKTTRIQYDDQTDLREYLQRILVACEIIKAAFYRPYSPGDNLPGDNLKDLRDQDESEQDVSWNDFLNELRNLEGQRFNPIAPKPDIKNLTSEENDQS